MRFASFVKDGLPSWGVYDSTTVADLCPELGKRAPTLRAALELDDFLGTFKGAIKNAARYPLTAVALAPVIPDPEKILCVGLNYEMHRKETGRSEVDHPT